MRGKSKNLSLVEENGSFLIKTPAPIPSPTKNSGTTNHLQIPFLYHPEVMLHMAYQYKPQRTSAYGMRGSFAQ